MEERVMMVALILNFGDETASSDYKLILLLVRIIILKNGLMALIMTSFNNSDTRNQLD